MGQSDRLALHLTPKAQADLEDIWLYTRDTWGTAQAENYLDSIQHVFDALCDMPELGRLYTEFEPTVRIHPSGRHLIIYMPEANALNVVRVLGARQNWRTMLDALDR